MVILVLKDCLSFGLRFNFKRFLLRTEPSAATLWLLCLFGLGGFHRLEDQRFSRLPVLIFGFILHDLLKFYKLDFAIDSAVDFANGTSVTFLRRFISPDHVTVSELSFNGFTIEEGTKLIRVKLSHWLLDHVFPDVIKHVRILLVDLVLINLSLGMVIISQPLA